MYYFRTAQALEVETVLQTLAWEQEGEGETVVSKIRRLLSRVLPPNVTGV